MEPVGAGMGFRTQPPSVELAVVNTVCGGTIDLRLRPNVALDNSNSLTLAVWQYATYGLNSETMHTRDLTHWQHEHVFNQDGVKPGERHTLLVVAITAGMMVVEITAGIAYGSMALLADGLHMASHATALGISLFAYIYARRQASDRRFSFGTGKVNSLAGFGSAVLLAGFAFAMASESTGRLINPVGIAFDQALIVAVLGLAVNAFSAWLLAARGDAKARGHNHAHHSDHNLRAAYLHVLADALTSLLAIVALLAGKYLGANWLDPVMGIVGSILVARWSLGLLRQTAHTLLDHQADDTITEALRTAIENKSTERVADLHVWSIGQGIYAAALTIISECPQSPDYYRALIPSGLHIAHATIEIHQCPWHP
jgi:cation diffusion facilitator family transporter